MAKRPVPKLSVLTRTLMAVYFASAAVFAIMTVWLVVRVVGSIVAARVAIPPVPGLLLVGACFLMLAAKIAGGSAYRKEVGAAGG